MSEDAELPERTARIRKGVLDFRQEALESIARSWEHCAEGRNECGSLALQDAQVWATLYLAERTGRRGLR